MKCEFFSNVSFNFDHSSDLFGAGIQLIRLGPKRGQEPGAWQTRRAFEKSLIERLSKKNILASVRAESSLTIAYL